MRFEGALGKLNESYFFREFTFSTNTFRPDKRTELELADAVVWLDDFLVVIQVKERYAAFGATSTDEENWFNSEVLGKAVTQIENTLRYLHSYDSIELANNQGHTFNLADAKDKLTHKLVIYHPNENLPEMRASQKFHGSATAGIIHIIRSADYLGLLETLITPAEVEQYLSFREELIKRWGNVGLQRCSKRRAILRNGTSHVSFICSLSGAIHLKNPRPIITEFSKSLPN